MGPCSFSFRTRFKTEVRKLLDKPSSHDGYLAGDGPKVELNFPYADDDPVEISDDDD